jgi:hypothetical protein
MAQVKQFRLVVASAALAGLCAAAAAEPPAAPTATDAGAAPASLGTAISGGKAHLDFRYRLESVDQGGFDNDATASTLRTRLNYETREWRDTTAFVEADNVTVLGDDEAYNSSVNGVTDRPLIADPEYTELNQAWLRITLDRMTGTLGRQRITLDNQRFVGNVGWRQNEQTYDAVTLIASALPRIRLEYAYLANVNRVTGPDEGSQPADYRSNSHLLNARLDLGGVGSLTGFAYLLDLENAPALSSSSYGLHWTGTHAATEKVKLNWIASIAWQQDYADNPSDVSAMYYLAEAGIGEERFALKAGYEVLGGDDQPNRAFQTPLATLHVFQGWADKFLTTPAAGVEDLYVGASGTIGGVTLQVVWHDFEAEAASIDYGSEWDASAGYRFGKRYDVLLKVADYRADGFATDTTKLWMQFSASF